MTTTSQPKKLNEILRTLVGSGVHGTGVGTDDRDEMGVYLNTPTQLLGIESNPESDTWRTQPEGVRSGQGDVDLMRYSLHKFMRLATAGNPSILVPLFAPEKDVLISTDVGQELRSLAPSIVSRNAGFRFLGYLESQRERMLGGGKQSRVPSRPELIEKYGFDTKYAGHAVRLGLQGIELMLTGRLTLPMPDSQRDQVLAIRKGEYDFAQCLDLIDHSRYNLETILHQGAEVVREKPNYDQLNAWMVSTYRRTWEW